MRRRNGYCAVLMLALVVVAQPLAWSQRCQVVEGGVGMGSCSPAVTTCGGPSLFGTCVTSVTKRNDSVFFCNCETSGGGIVPAGEPGPAWPAAIAGPFQATALVEVKELNTGATTLKNLHSFIVNNDGSSAIQPVGTLGPGQTLVQTFELPGTLPAPVVVGVIGSNLKGVRFDAVSWDPTGNTFNVPNKDWTEVSKAPYYITQPVVDLRVFPATGVLGPYGSSSTTATFQLFLYNSQNSDQAYTLNVVDDTGTTKSSMPVTVPAGQIGDFSLATLPDFNTTITGGLGIAGVNLANQNVASLPGAGSKGPAK